MFSPYEFGTVGTYVCDNGFGLSGEDGTVVCGGDGSSPDGAWNGIPPTCDGKLAMP